MASSKPLIVALILIHAGHVVGQSKDASLHQSQLLINQYCVSCHGAERPAGELPLTAMEKSHWGDYRSFAKLLNRVESGEMPPEDAGKKLGQGDRRKLLLLLKARMRQLDQSSLAGGLRKLTANEYSHSLADIFGFPLSSTESLPFDSDRDLKKLTEHQVVTSFALKKYYAVAHEYLERHLIHEQIEPRETRYTAENGRDFFGRRYTTKLGAVAGGGNPPIFVVRSPVTTYAEEGEYELEFDWYCFYGPRNDPQKHQKVKPIRTPSLQFHQGRTNNKVLNASQHFEKNRIAKCSMDKPIRLVLKKDTKFLSFRGPDRDFKTFDKSDPRYVKIVESALPKNKKRAALKELGKKLMRELHGDKEMFILIQGVRFRGPLNKPETAFNQRLFGDIKRTDSVELCLPLLERKAKQLFRRPPAKAVLDSYKVMALKEYSQSKNCYQATKVALNAMLCSPHFLFKNEGDQNQLDDFAIASRLSYFLWNSAPDAELLELAEQGKLQDPEIRRRQAIRLLADRSRSSRFLANFTNQWLGLDKFGAYTPNEAYLANRLFSPLKPSLAKEPVALLSHLVRQNRSATELIHSDSVVWNQPLLSHYQRGTPELKLGRVAKWKDKETFRELTLSENPGKRRGGLISMAAIMSLTTDGENTHPILRGVWVARRLLGIEIEAPASVPAIEVNLENVSKPREILAKHKEDKTCFACHKKFDHFGLALENYDVIGRWKTEYVHPVQNEKGRFTLVKKDVIDSHAETPDGHAISGVSGLKDYLLRHRETVIGNLNRVLFKYAIGREVRYSDHEHLTELFEKAVENDFKLRDMILELVASTSFARR